ncbi:hypothetical protein [Thermopetrobacter sp. TC1]|uniref:hypothetical protein n=1 Tax=Thermopetrobacter sp. TC1 TaxID=1495045 RepID=UPI0018CFB71E|nr:hypothetical protein [Thermopetrobacter sp. TC1]
MNRKLIRFLQGIRLIRGIHDSFKQGCQRPFFRECPFRSISIPLTKGLHGKDEKLRCEFFQSFQIALNLLLDVSTDGCTAFRIPDSINQAKQMPQPAQTSEKSAPPCACFHPQPGIQGQNSRFGRFFEECRVDVIESMKAHIHNIIAPHSFKEGAHLFASARGVGPENDSHDRSRPLLPLSPIAKEARHRAAGHPFRPCIDSPFKFSGSAHHHPCW